MPPCHGHREQTLSSPCPKSERPCPCGWPASSACVRRTGSWSPGRAWPAWVGAHAALCMRFWGSSGCIIIVRSLILKWMCTRPAGGASLSGDAAKHEHTCEACTLPGHVGRIRHAHYPMPDYMCGKAHAGAMEARGMGPWCSGHDTHVPHLRPSDGLT